ncbi:IS110 family transposase [bacterium]|nr:IS110 family transposase [bacterium]
MIQHSTQTIWVGMDVHQASITAAILHGDSVEPQVVRLPGDLNAARRLFRRLAEKGVPRACYEASGAGYVLQRTLSDDGFHCEVIAPSLIPSRPGDHRKTDRLDAVHLAQQFRSGHLTAVSVPDVDQEAVRHLVRARLFNRIQITRSKNRITGILRVAGYHFTETETGWTKAHRAWMAKLRRELTGPMQTVLASELQLLEYLEASLSSLEAAITEVSVQSPWREPVEALCCFRGVKTLTAMTIVSEIGDIKRFSSPRQLMSYVGLVPSERSSGERSRRGPITKAGNRHLRRVLIESSQPCRRRAASTLRLQRRRAGQNPTLVGIALKAQHRLERRYAHLARTKHTNKAITAVAREFCGFVWAMLWEVQGRH